MRVIRCGTIFDLSQQTLRRPVVVDGDREPVSRNLESDYRAKNSHPCVTFSLEAVETEIAQHPEECLVKRRSADILDVARP